MEEEPGFIRGYTDVPCACRRTTQSVCSGRYVSENRTKMGSAELV